jgi:hypothetical protein
MSAKQSKRLRRAVRKESDKIKIQGLGQFVDFINAHGFLARCWIAVRIVFKRVKI